MLVKKNKGGALINLGLFLLVLAAIAVVISYRLEGTARVKLVKRDTAVDAVTGTVNVDADGGTKELKSEAAGKILWCEALGLGNHFKENDPLLKLDSSELERSIADTKRKYEQETERARVALTGGQPELLADAHLTDAERTEVIQKNNPARKRAKEVVDTAKRVFELGNIAEEEMKTAERALEAIDLELKVKALEEKTKDADYDTTMAALKDQLKRMAILAPSDGQVDQNFAWKGMLINTGQTVATFFSNTRLVAAKISEESFGKIRVGQKARLRLLTYGRQEFDAVVSKLLPKADDAQRFTAFLDVKVDPEQLKPGSTGEVTITVEERANALMIQRRALFDSDKVYVVKNGRVEKRLVKVGFMALNVVEIREGLQEGEQVIVDNLDEFRNGQRVRTEVLN